MREIMAFIAGVAAALHCFIVFAPRDTKIHLPVSSSTQSTSVESSGCIVGPAVHASLGASVSLPCCLDMCLMIDCTLQY
jgi:hypothetical protein